MAAFRECVQRMATRRLLADCAWRAATNMAALDRRRPWSFPSIARSFLPPSYLNTLKLVDCGSSASRPLPLDNSQNVSNANFFALSQIERACCSQVPEAWIR